MKFLTLGMALFFSVIANAEYKVAIYTDQVDGVKANEVIQYLRTTPPLNRFDISFQVIQKPSSFLDCGARLGITRLIGCDTRAISSDASRNGFDQAFVVSDLDEYGGSGGEIPVITSHPSTPVSMMLHEYMHTIGFADEYEYSATEASIYCTPNELSNWINLAVIEPNTSGYTGDADARSQHRRAIPWYGNIEGSTAIATTNLGTPAQQAAQIGLFRAQTCNQASPVITTWKPNGELSIMELLNRPVGRLAPILEDALRSRGISLKSQAEIEALPTTTATGTTGDLEDTTHTDINRDLVDAYEPIHAHDHSSHRTPRKVETVDPNTVVELNLGSVSEEVSTEGSLGSQESEFEVALDEHEAAHATSRDSAGVTSDEAPEPTDNSPNCNEKMNDFFEDPENSELKKEYMKLQGKITLHRIAWTFLKQADSPTDTIEGLIEEMIIRRDPALYREFVNSGAKTRNEKLGFAISELKRTSQGLITDDADKAYALHYSDVKMMNLLVNAEDLNGRTMANGVMDFTSIIKNSLNNKFSKKQSNLRKFQSIIDSLTAEKNAFESKLLTYLKSVNCDTIRNNDTCEVQAMTGAHLSQILENTENIIDFVYQDDFGRQEELKDIYQWRNYWLHVGR